jgi:cytochrome c553
MRKRTILLLTFAGLSFIAAAILLMSGPRMRYQPSIRAFETTMPYPPGNSIEFFAYDTTIASMPVASEENIKKGQTYYIYYCSFCHGNDLKGNGEVGKSYMPKPSDLSGEIIRSYSTEKLYLASFTGTGHSPVLQRIIPYDYRQYILIYLRVGIK